MQHRVAPLQAMFPPGRTALGRIIPGWTIRSRTILGRAILPSLSLHISLHMSSRTSLSRATIARHGTGIRNLFGSHRFHRSECRNHAQRSIFRNHSDFMQGYNSVAQENNHVGSPR